MRWPFAPFNNVGVVYGIYTGGFVFFIALVALLEHLDVPRPVIGHLFIFLTIIIYAFIGLVSRTANPLQYYVAGRSVPPIYNGMATAADWMSAASFIGMAGWLYFSGYDGLAFVLGWTGGFVLVGVLLAPYLRKFAQFTVPDFLGARYDSHLVRVLAVIVLITTSFLYVVAQIVGIGLITGRFLGLPFGVAVFVGLAGILLCSMLGGMRAVTWTQVAQFIIMIVAYLVPVVMLSVKLTGLPLPQLTYGLALEKIELLEHTLGIARAHAAPFADGEGHFSLNAAVNFFALVFCLMVGTASLPHLLMRSYTVTSVRGARSSVAWCLFFIFVLYMTAPAYAAFAKLEVYEHVIGQPIAHLPAWVYSWGQVGLISVKDANGDGILQLSEFSLRPEAVVLATPEIAGLPYVVTGLVAAGGLAAALSTADGLLLAIANGLSHDLYGRLTRRPLPPARRLLASRILLVLVTLSAAWVARTVGADILFLVAWAFSIAASGLFAPLVLAVWDKRTNAKGAAAGMVCGFGICMLYLIGSEFFGETMAALFGGWIDLTPERGRMVARLWGIDNVSAGLFGVPTAFLVTWTVSRMTAPPPAATADFVDSIRSPAGPVRLIDPAHAVE